MFKTRFPAVQQLASMSNLALALKATAVSIAVLAMFYRDLNIVFNDALQDEATSHLLAIPIVFAYFVYRKRKMIRGVTLFGEANQPNRVKHFAAIGGLLMVATAIILYWYGSYTFTPLEYHLLMLPLFTAGLVLAVFNPQTLRQLAFPIFFFVFLTPPPNEILYGLGSTLSVIGSEVSCAIANALGVPSVISSEYGNPTIIITRLDKTTIGFTVDIACSGIYSLIGFLVFAAFLAYIVRDKTWKKIATFLIGLPLLFALNILRITTILLIGYHYGEQLALQVFHLLGGWILIFIGTLILLTISERAFKTRIFTRTKPHPCPECNPRPTNSKESFCLRCGRILKHPQAKLQKTDIAKIAAVAIAAILLVSIQTPTFALTHTPAHIIIQTPTGEQGNTAILPQMQGHTLEFVSRDRDFEEKAKQDLALTYSYTPEDKPQNTVWIAMEISSTLSSLHRWETCLITFPQTHGYQPKVAQLDLRDTQILPNPPIIARYFAFEYASYNQTQIVLYWFETSVFNINNATQQKHVKISLITYPTHEENTTEAENRLLPIATAIANYWQPIKTWTQIALIISKNGLALAGATATLLVAIIFLEAFQKIRGKKTNKNTYSKLSITDQQIIKAVGETSGTPTPHNIAITYQKLSDKEITTNDLIRKLTQAEKTGLIEKNITNDQDQPLLVYKSNVQHSTTAIMKNKPDTSAKTHPNQPQTPIMHQKRRTSSQTSNNTQTPKKCQNCPELLQCPRRKSARLIRNCNRNKNQATTESV